MIMFIAGTLIGATVGVFLYAFLIIAADGRDDQADHDAQVQALREWRERNRA